MSYALCRSLCWYMLVVVGVGSVQHSMTVVWWGWFLSFSMQCRSRAGPFSTYTDPLFNPNHVFNPTSVSSILSLPSHREPVWEHHQQKCLFTNLPTEPLLGEARRLWLQGAGDTSATTFEVFLLKECNKVPKVTSTRYFLQNVKLLKTQGVHRGVLSSNARVRNLFHSWLPCQQVELLNKGDFFLTNKLNNWTKITLPTSWPSRQK